MDMRKGTKKSFLIYMLMMKLISILLLGLLLSGNAYAENEDFIKKHLSNNSLYKQNPKTDFFFGKFKINSSFTKNINFYYAAREETKDGQFYIFYIKNTNPIFLISEETTYFDKEKVNMFTFAPKKVQFLDLNNDGKDEIILSGISWGTGSETLFKKAYYFVEPGIVNKDFIFVSIDLEMKRKLKNFFQRYWF